MKKKCECPECKEEEMCFVNIGVEGCIMCCENCDFQRPATKKEIDKYEGGQEA